MCPSVSGLQNEWRVTAWPWFNIKMPFYHHIKAHCWDKKSYDRIIPIMGFPILLRRHLYTESPLGSVFYLWLSNDLAIERKRYICNVFSRWPSHCSAIEIEHGPWIGTAKMFLKPFIPRKHRCHVVPNKLQIFRCTLSPRQSLAISS